MYPLHKEKYYLTGETFHTFMRDRLAGDLKKEQRSYHLTAAGMFAAAVAVLIFMYTGTNTDIRSDFVWMVMPVALVALGIANLNKARNAVRGLDNKIIKDYTDHKYEKEQISVKFYEDRVAFSHGDKNEEYFYNSFKKYYEAEKYFAVYFHTGEIVILNPN